MALELVYLCGGYNLLFAVFHAAFWRLFGWRRELGKLQPANRAIVQVLNLRLIYVFLLFGALALEFAGSLLATPLGRFLLGGMTLFWLGRLVEQLFFLRLNGWQVHLLTLFFALGVVLHSLPLLLTW